MTKTRRLYRKDDNKILGGVCAGIADYFDVDPSIVRILTVLLMLSGTGIIAYIVAWIIVPLENEK